MRPSFEQSLSSFFVCSFPLSRVVFIYVRSINLFILLGPVFYMISYSSVVSIGFLMEYQEIRLLMCRSFSFAILVAVQGHLDLRTYNCSSMTFTTLVLTSAAILVSHHYRSNSLNHHLVQLPYIYLWWGSHRVILSFF